MNAAELAVAIGGLAAIAWVNWWFFVAGERTATVAPNSGPQEVTVVVRGGYEPKRIRVRAGQPVRLVFDRQETNSCSEEVVFPDFGVRRFLPPFQKTAVELRPEHTGRFEFTCGMSMLRGTLDVE